MLLYIVIDGLDVHHINFYVTVKKLLKNEKLFVSILFIV